LYIIFNIIVDRYIAIVYAKNHGPPRRTPGTFFDKKTIRALRKGAASGPETWGSVGIPGDVE
jgi:hypothetical protein